MNVFHMVPLVKRRTDFSITPAEWGLTVLVPEFVSGNRYSYGYGLIGMI